MARRRKEETTEDIIQEAEVVMRWSKKRIGIGTFLVVCIILGGMYAISLMSQGRVNVLGEKAYDRPKIKLPSEKSIDEVIENVKKELTNVNAKNIIESQPRIKKIIDDLTNLTGSSNSAKSLICDSWCK